MNELINPNIVQGVLATLVASLIIWMLAGIKAKYDQNKIISFLKKSKKETNHTFRTTHAIASETNLSKERVGKLGSKSKKIKRNQKEKESWKLAE